MELKPYTIRVGDFSYNVIHCYGHGQCQCSRCKSNGVYNVLWT